MLTDYDLRNIAGVMEQQSRWLGQWAMSATGRRMTQLGTGVSIRLFGYPVDEPQWKYDAAVRLEIPDGEYSQIYQGTDAECAAVFERIRQQLRPWEFGSGTPRSSPAPAPPTSLDQATIPAGAPADLVEVVDEELPF